MSISASVIIATYNQPLELDLVLCGLSMQKTPAEEILIADDGSRVETKNVINNWSKKIKTPLKHIWHEDKGNRKLRICNKAVNASIGNYLIFLDGDSIPHHLWINDHIYAAKENTVLCGRRVRLGPLITKSIDKEFIKARKLESMGGSLFLSAIKKDTKRFLHGIRLQKHLARCFHPTERRLMGVNFSLHKELFLKVGGYKEPSNNIVASMENRREDAQLEIELLKAGTKRYPLINQGIVYHLYHKERPVSEEIDQYIQAHYEDALQQRKTNAK